jgi:hypothetical protein
MTNNLGGLQVEEWLVVVCCTIVCVAGQSSRCITFKNQCPTGYYYGPTANSAPNKDNSGGNCVTDADCVLGMW